MAWVYLDDCFPDHPKVIVAEAKHERAPWLFVAGLAYCRRHLTSGLIPAVQVPTLVRRYSKNMTAGLVESGLWDVIGIQGKPVSAYRVHDYEIWNASEDEQRAKRSEKARKAAEARWGK